MDSDGAFTFNRHLRPFVAVYNCLRPLLAVIASRMALVALRTNGFIPFFRLLRSSRISPRISTSSARKWSSYLVKETFSIDMASIDQNCMNHNRGHDEMVCGFFNGFIGRLC
jgi:hypothetical protein